MLLCWLSDAGRPWSTNTSMSERTWTVTEWQKICILGFKSCEGKLSFLYPPASPSPPLQGIWCSMAWERNYNLSCIWQFFLSLCCIWKGGATWQVLCLVSYLLLYTKPTPHPAPADSIVCGGLCSLFDWNTDGTNAWDIGICMNEKIGMSSFETSKIFIEIVIKEKYMWLRNYVKIFDILWVM